MTTMRRRKQWLLARQQESLRSKRNNWLSWKQFFIEGIRTMVKIMRQTFHAFGMIVKGYVDKVREDAKKAAEEKAANKEKK